MSAISSDLLPVFGALPGACLLLSPELVIEAASEAYLAVTLTQRENVVGKYVFAVFPDNPNSLAASAKRTVQASLDQVLATGRPHELTLQPYDLPDPAQPGHFLARYWRTRNAPVLDAQGRVAHIIHEVTDVTEQVQASTELRESQVREQTAHAQAEHQRGELQRIFEQAPVAIAVYRGPNYVIELANPTVCRLWGREAKDILGKGLFEALPEVAGMGYEQLLDGVMATGQPVAMHAMEAQHDRNGTRETVYWDFVYVPMYEGDGDIYGAMVVATEVSEQVQARQKIQELNDQLAAANQALHESNGELLANQEEVLKVQQMLENALAEAQRRINSAAH